jgi:hypothetical protein
MTGPRWRDLRSYLYTYFTFFTPFTCYKAHLVAGNFRFEPVRTAVEPELDRCEPEPGVRSKVQRYP